MSHHNALRVKELACGRWLEIFQSLAPSLKTAIEHLGRHVPCPVHGGEDGFRLFADAAKTGGGICNTCGAHVDGFSMLVWVNGWSFSETVNAVGDYLNDPSSLVSPRSKKPALGHFRPKTDLNDGLTREEEREEKERQANRNRKRVHAVSDVWERSHALELNAKGESERVELIGVVEKYFKARSIPFAQALSWLDGNEVHVVGELPYWENVGSDEEGKSHQTLVGKFPALVCRVTAPNGEVVTLHRTFLTKEGTKASVRKPKKLMALPSNRTIKGGAIRLSRVQGDTLAVAEGIETALSVIVATKQACWSVICANGMQTFVPPKGIRRVLIYADHDRSGVGLESAKVLAARLREQGLICRIMMPRKVGFDWNDVLSRGGEIPR